MAFGALVGFAPVTRPWAVPNASTPLVDAQGKMWRLAHVVRGVRAFARFGDDVAVASFPTSE